MFSWFKFRKKQTADASVQEVPGESDNLEESDPDLPNSDKCCPGKYYVNCHCANHDLCHSIAPGLFQRDDEKGYFYVVKQPETSDELQLMQECIDACPIEAIRDDGETIDWPREPRKSEEKTKAHPLNVDGPFYVTNDCCTLCAVIFEEAPDMFRVNDKQDHCYVSKQPETDEQVDRMIEVMNLAELRYVRCRSNDPVLLEKIRGAGEGEQCDVEL
jgi:ferredoxin